MDMSTVTTIAIVMGVVEALKRAGVKGQASFISAIALAFIVFAGEQAAATWPAVSVVFGVIRYGLYGVAATGWYDLLGKRGQEDNTPVR